MPRDRGMVAGVRLPRVVWERLRKQAEAEGWPDVGALIRDRIGAPQPGDASWPSRAGKRMRAEVTDATGG